MRAITNQTGTPQWDAHGRMIPHGRIIAFEENQPEMPETTAPPSDSKDDLPPNTPIAPPSEAKGGKGSSK